MGMSATKAVSCLAGGPVVKVMLPDATIEEYDHAIQVAELVSMYPNYAVVHCSSAKPSHGFRTVIVMKMDEVLVPGQAYILYAIPKSCNDSVRVSASDLGEPQSDPSSSPEAGPGGMKSMTEGSLTADELAKSLSKTLMGPALRRKVPAHGLCLMDLEKEEWQQKERTEKKAEADLALAPCAWTPDLYQISED